MLLQDYRRFRLFFRSLAEIALQDRTIKNTTEHSYRAGCGKVAIVPDAKKELLRKGCDMTDSETGAADGPAVVAEGKAAVRQLFVQRVDEAGLVRMKGVTADAHARMIDRLVDKLAYLRAANLMVLAECVIDYSAQAAGVGRGAWPAEVLVIGWAHGLQAPAPQTAPIVASWLRSVEGPVADAGGYLVELYRHLIRHPVPVMVFTLTRIKEEASDNQRRQALIRDRIARNVDMPEDRAWLAAYLADQRTARELVDLGKAGRAAAKGEAA